MCKSQCNRNTQKVLCTNGSNIGSPVPIDTSPRTREFILDPENVGVPYVNGIGQWVYFTYTELYSASANQVILLLKTVEDDTRPGGTMRTYPLPPNTYSFGTCQKCPIDSFDVDCANSPNGFCCIKNKVVEDACKRLKG
jgi:hypothetical protein